MPNLNNPEYTKTKLRAKFFFFLEILLSPSAAKVGVVQKIRIQYRVQREIFE